MSSHTPKCMCGICHKKRIADGTEAAFEEELRKETDKVLKNIKNSYTSPKPTLSTITTHANDTEYIKKLFETVQGVNFQDKCPHGYPYYACMPCSH